LSPESDSEGDGEVYIVGNGEEVPEKAVKEIRWETDEELACTAQLGREAKRRKRHNDLQDDSGASEDEPRDGTPVRRHHPKVNSWHKADRDWLRNRSRAIREEINQIEYQGSRSTALLHRMPQPQECSSINWLPNYQKTMKKLMHTLSASRRCWM
jgi:hypothetical protein